MRFATASITSFRYSADPFKMSEEVNIEEPLRVDNSELFDNSDDIVKSKIGAVMACLIYSCTRILRNDDQLFEGKEF